MKNLSDLLNEALMNESRTNCIIFFSHDEPSDTRIYVGSNPKTIEKLTNGYFQWIEVDKPGNVILITHDDEDGYAIPYASENAFKSSVLKDIKKCIKDAGDDPDELEIDCDVLGTSIDDEDEVKEIVKMSDSQLYQKFVIDFINDSEIDGDSASGKVLVDIKAKKVLIDGGMDISFYDDDDVAGMY